MKPRTSKPARNGRGPLSRKHVVTHASVPTASTWRTDQAKAITIHEPVIILDDAGRIVGAFTTMTDADRVVRWNNGELGLSRVACKGAAS